MADRGLRDAHVRDLVVDAGRAEQPFTVHLAGGGWVVVPAGIDAAGTWSPPNPPWAPTAVRPPARRPRRAG